MSSASASSQPIAAPAQKILVGIAGATGVVGQRFLSLLSHHPWFEIHTLSASDKSAGKKLKEAATWRLATPCPDSIADKVIEANTVQTFVTAKCALVFSALDANVAGEFEEGLAKAGIKVFSNARNHRYDATVPILIPHANSEHIQIIPAQQKERGYSSGGYIITNANCSSTGLVVALRPLQDAFGIDKLFVTTMQAISGAGYPGVASLDIVDNVVPYISGEEDKMELEPQKILGTISQGDAPVFVPASFKVSAQCNRVAVIDGHMECVSLKLKKEGVTVEQVEAALRNWKSEAQTLQLPSAPKEPIFVHTLENRPQPRFDRDRENGYVVTLGRVRTCPILDFKFVLCSHNTVLGAAGGSILNAELAYAKGFLQ